MEEENSLKSWGIGFIVLGIGIAIFGGILWSMLWGWQYFKVFRAEQTGRAELAQAEQNRQIAVLEAQAANESATLQAEAQIKISKAQAQSEIERAKGAAEANRIIADSLKGNEAYLRYLWIQQVAGKNGVIYVPTEAGLPILEAGKR